MRMKKLVFFLTGFLLPFVSLAQVDSFSKKITLLDFWASWCVPCVQKLPALQSLQEEFPDQLQVVLVNSIHTGDPVSRVTELLQAKNISLPSITQDSILVQRFPHTVVPHYVWLGKDGQLLGTTSGDLVTKTTVDKLLRREPIAFNESIVSTELYRSSLTSYQPGKPNQVGEDTTAAGYRFYTTNTSALQLYQLFYPAYRQYPDYRIRFEGLDRDDQLPGTQDPDAWNRAHTYCYELVLPRSQQADSLRWLRADLDRFFGWRFSTRREKTACYVLRSTGQVHFDHDTNQAPAVALLRAGEGPKYLRQMPLSLLIDHLNLVLDRPILDETGYTGLITLDLPDDYRNSATLRKRLRRHGLLLTTETRTLDFLFIQKP